MSKRKHCCESTSPMSVHSGSEDDDRLLVMHLIDYETNLLKKHKSVISHAPPKAEEFREKKFRFHRAKNGSISKAYKNMTASDSLPNLASNKDRSLYLQKPISMHDFGLVVKSLSQTAIRDSSNEDSLARNVLQGIFTQKDPSTSRKVGKF